MKRFYVIGNWKMHKTFTETLEFFELFQYSYKKYLKNNPNLAPYVNNNVFAVAPAHCNLASYFTNKVPELKLCSQNMSKNEEGAFTGEVSARMLQDLNVTFAICGHSERRMYHSSHENDESINKKIIQCVKYNITPIICVGESREAHSSGNTKEAIRKQLRVLLNEVNIEKVVIAYEPIWSIGSGKTPTPSEVENVCAMIHELTSPNIPVLYGGSVNANNVNDFVNLDNVNGFLVGSASLEIDSFLKLISVNAGDK
ncbi:triose-phosphate isomerase [Mycoplasma tauri]|uniref:triose-phosphate isomerase n=1 Tax=Mycoplasma tauri TaxID=547987 RepID=UPI00196878F8|nr:triose-phosphate isomerase [Mycoplasma tauri]MBZ4203473.1 triose-phosphate isomerase [Mycoplasma tauri]MBZ4204542.1 triose-phosphate isomerase [Mycoplasma tauri]MBZ4218387.1 triose-phosphate isomerase [Mycoplasma tauri]MBZ4227070.1 triose-phosphate isomerase [Mycoplasma tauri]QSB07709.1 triose-phosphate isomerase [Mycoplasma tauri]